MNTDDRREIERLRHQCRELQARLAKLRDYWDAIRNENTTLIARLEGQCRELQAELVKLRDDITARFERGGRER